MSDEKRVLRIGDKEVVLDPALMKFNETTLSNFLETEAAYYDYFGWQLADAEYFMQRMEGHYDVLYAERFKEFKESGKSDKMAEQSAKADEDVERAHQIFLDAKHNVRQLQNHLRAWDRAHENAQSRGHFLRKEMDKLKVDIYEQSYAEKRGIERIAQEVVQSYDAEDFTK